jgi:hypothetical protein
VCHIEAIKNGLKVGTLRPPFHGDVESPRLLSDIVGPGANANTKGENETGSDGLKAGRQLRHVQRAWIFGRNQRMKGPYIRGLQRQRGELHVGSNLVQRRPGVGW